MKVASSDQMGADIRLLGQFLSSKLFRPAIVYGADEAVTVEGRSYDTCVLQEQTVLLLVENIEDVKAPGLLWKLAQEAAGCHGLLVEESTGMCCPLIGEVDTKGVYNFTPHEVQGGLMETIEKATGYLARALTTSFLPGDTKKSD